MTFSSHIVQNIVSRSVTAFLAVTVILGMFTPFSVSAETFGVTTLYPSKTSVLVTVLNGHVESSTKDEYSVWFEYGTNGSFQYISYKNTFKGSRDFGANIFRLKEDTVYTYRAVAQKKKTGQTIYGETKTFIFNDPTADEEEEDTTDTTTGSGASYGGSAGVKFNTPTGTTVDSSNSATLRDTVPTSGLISKGWFEWGTTRSLGNETSRKDLPSGAPYLSISETLYNLKPATTYYYRSAVSNVNGIRKGEIKSFTTDKGDTVPTSSGSTSATCPQSVCPTTTPSATTTTGQTASTTNNTKKSSGFTLGGLFSGSDDENTDTTASGVEAAKIGATLGWGSSLHGQMFTIDENGTIEANDYAFGFDDKSGDGFLASVFSLDILPNSFLGWMVWVLIAFIAVSQIRRVATSNQKRQEEKERYEEEMKELKKYQEMALRNKKTA